MKDNKQNSAQSTQAQPSNQPATAQSQGGPQQQQQHQRNDKNRAQNQSQNNNYQRKKGKGVPHDNVPHNTADGSEKWDHAGYE